MFRRAIVCACILIVLVSGIGTGIVAAKGKTPAPSGWTSFCGSVQGIDGSLSTLPYALVGVKITAQADVRPDPYTTIHVTMTTWSYPFTSGSAWFSLQLRDSTGWPPWEEKNVIWSNGVRLKAEISGYWTATATFYAYGGWNLRMPKDQPADEYPVQIYVFTQHAQKVEYTLGTVHEDRVVFYKFPWDNEVTNTYVVNQGTFVDDPGQDLVGRQRYMSTAIYHELDPLNPGQVVIDSAGTYGPPLLDHIQFQSYDGQFGIDVNTATNFKPQKIYTQIVDPNVGWHFNYAEIQSETKGLGVSVSAGVPGIGVKVLDVYYKCTNANTNMIDVWIQNPDNVEHTYKIAVGGPLAVVWMYR